MTSRLPKGFAAFITTQALGSFNDNLFKMLVQLYVLVIVIAPDAEELIALSALVFTLPFVIFDPWSGWLADRFAKARVIQVLKFCEIGVMVFGVAAFLLESIP